MTREEVKADVENSIEEFLQSIAEQDAESSGIQPPTRIEESVSETQPKPFDLGLEEFPLAEADDAGSITISYPRGACCCCDGTCSEQSESECDASGCNFHGADTVCDDEGDPCVATGACCAEDVCTIESEADCGGEGGTYQGDCTMCTPNPCMPSCECYFTDGGNHYLTRITTIDGTVDDPLGHHGTADGTNETWHVTKTETYTDCVLNCTASGTTEDHYDSDPDTYGACRNTVSACSGGTLICGVNFDIGACSDCDTPDAPCSPQLCSIAPTPVVTYANPCTPV